MKKLALALLTITAASPAYAVDKIYTPYVEGGEWELEYFGAHSVDDNNTKDNANVHEFSVGYGVNDWWKTELYGIWEKEPMASTTFDAIEWENIFQFTKPGEYWADVGASIAYEWTPHSHHADALEAKLLLAKPIGKTLNVLNLTLQKEVGSGPRDDMQASLAWSTRYNYSPYFEPGFEIQSQFGQVNDPVSFQNQEHYIGPVVYGTIPFEVEGDEIEGLQYRAGYLFGVSDAASDGQAVIQLEYGLEF